MLREVDLYPNALCPTHPDSFPLLSVLIEQMMELHQNDPYLHIGADEVEFFVSYSKFLFLLINSYSV